MDSVSHMPRKLYKSRYNRMIDGVCGGIAEYFSVDPTIVRILWVLITLLGGSGLFLYIAGMIIMPANPEQLVQPQTSSSTPTPNSDRRRYWGIVLILIGIFILMSNFGWFTGFSWWSFSRTVVFPLMLILVGLLFIYVHTHRQVVPSGAERNISEEAASPRVEGTKELRRSIKDKKICGVCGGLATFFNIDSTIIRILFVFLVFASFGWALLLYIILCLLMPEEKLTTSTV